jgi:predicted transposase/invertase (TIGR01784 family)
LIGRSITVTTITANEPPIDNLRDRQIRFDIACKAEDGELVNVEMGLNPDSFEPIRLEFHAGRLFTAQDIKGSEKTYEDLKSAYQIALLGKKRFFPDEIVFHTFQYFDPINKVPLNGKTRIITVELSKAYTAANKSANERSAQEQWAVFFQYSTDKAMRTKINEILEIEEGIAMASEILMTISKDEVERARLVSEYKYQLDNQSKLVHAKREGIQEGRIEGRIEGQQEEREKWQGVVAEKDALIAKLKAQLGG